MNHGDAVSVGIGGALKIDLGTPPQHDAAVALEHPGDDFHQRGFARAVFSDQGMDLSGFYVEVAPSKRRHAGEIFFNALQIQKHEIAGQRRPRPRGENGATVPSPPVPRSRSGLMLQGITAECVGANLRQRLARFFSPGGEAKCARGPSVQGARRSAPHFLNNAGVLEQYVEHGEQAQRRNGGPIVCFDRQLVRNAG